MHLIEKDKKYLLPVYTKFPLTITRGSGSYVWDDEGKKYLDFYGGHAVCILGHCFEPVVEAIKKQAQELIFYSNVLHTKPAIELAEKLAQTLLPNEYKIFFCNSGSEANETAIKLARKYSGKNRIISFTGAFHGRSITNLAVTGIESYQKYEPNLRQHTDFANLGDIESVKNAYSQDTAAIMLEAIQSVGGMNMVEKSFYKEVAEFCKEKGILLIMDEVQTGLGRSGTFWFCQKLEIEPDIITSAKGLGSGLPLSAVIVKDEIASSVQISDHSTTFGGGCIPCSAGLAVVNTIFNPEFLKHVNEVSDLIKEGLSSNSKVKAILGEGLLLGIELFEPSKGLVKRCLEKGLIIGDSSRQNVYRITPPLNISKEEVEEFLTIFNSIL